MTFVMDTVQFTKERVFIHRSVQILGEIFGLDSLDNSSDTLACADAHGAKGVTALYAF